MELIVIVTVLALAQFYWFGIQVGSMRGKHGVPAPAVSGPPEFERMFRVQQNTMEQLVITIPSLWLFGYYVDARWGAGIGLVYIIARFIYRAGYVKDPAKRGTGFTIGVIATTILLIGPLVAAIRNLL